MGIAMNKDIGLHIKFAPLRFGFTPPAVTTEDAIYAHDYI
jgi:hypothetical protein